MIFIYLNISVGFATINVFLFNVRNCCSHAQKLYRIPSVTVQSDIYIRIFYYEYNFELLQMSPPDNESGENLKIFLELLISKI